MREIKFRAKSELDIESLDRLRIPHKNGWVYGNYVDGFMVGDVIDVDEDFIAFEWWVAVYEGTVGQYTGLEDKNGKEIYEGDIIKEKVNENEYIYCEVVYERETFKGQEPGHEPEYPIYDWTDGEVIGKIYDNPELLEVK